MLALGKDRQILPSIVSRVHPVYRTPWNASLIIGSVVLLAAGLLPLRLLANVVMVTTLSSFVVVAAAMLVMRRTHPDLKRPFRAPLGPLAPILTILTSGMLLVSLPVSSFGEFALWTAAGVIIYACYGRRQSHPTQEPCLPSTWTASEPRAAVADTAATSLGA
jgi:APA family basic amino acid/polyamine antiporter